MKKFFGILALCLAFALPAHAANVNIDGLPAASSVATANLFECEQSGVNRKCTGTQIAAFINSLVSGDCTATGPGVFTCTKLNGSTPGTSFTVNTGTSGATIPLLNGINTWGAKQTFGAVALGGITGSVQCLHVDASGNISGIGSDCGSAAGGVTNIATACGTTGGPITTTGTISAALTVRTVAGTSDTILAADCGNVVQYTSATSIAVAQPAPTGSFVAGFFTTLCTAGAGTATVTPGSGTIGGAGTYALPGGIAAAPVCVTYQSDGTNFNLVPSFMRDAALLNAGTLAAGRMPALTGDITTSAGAVATTLATVNSNVGSFGSTTQCVTFTVNGKGLVTAASAATCAPNISSVAGLGSGVATAAAAALSAAGGLSTTVASGTSAMGTSAIASAACATVVTTTATNTATTDVVQASFNGDPTAVTGYVPLTTGMLTIIAYPTANNVNFKVCNNTSGSITPGAITLNWRVAR